MYQIQSIFLDGCVFSFCYWNGFVCKWCWLYKFVVPNIYFFFSENDFYNLMYRYFAFGLFLQLVPLLLQCHLLTKLISWSFKMAGRKWCHDSMFLDLRCSDLLDTVQFLVSLIHLFFSSPILIPLITVNHQWLNDLHLLLALIWIQILASHTLGKSDVFSNFTNVLVSCIQNCGAHSHRNNF
jgi:hypothetical protein